MHTVKQSYMTVLFLVLYCACIWSILGTVRRRGSSVEFKHLRVVKAGLRARSIWLRARVHAEQVQDPKVRSPYGRNGVANDIAGCSGYRLWPCGDENASGSSPPETASINRFGTLVWRSSDQEILDVSYNIQSRLDTAMSTDRAHITSALERVL